MTWPLLLSVLLSLSRAQDIEGGRQIEMASDESARAVAEALSRDPAAADSLAARILRSELAGRICGATEPAARLAELRRWIRDDPDTAARLAQGLAQDDAAGNHDFENAVLRNTSRSLRINEDNVARSSFGRLRKTHGDSKLMKADEDMSDEEKREILRSMFEGQGNMSNQIVVAAPGGQAARPEAASAAFAGSYYDRLSQLNLRGYSAQVMAIQSALNQRRAPGAPKLLETGRLDYETLSYPAYGMRYDLRNLELRLRYQRNFELARLAGLTGRYRPEQLLEPAVEELLRQKASGARLEARFSRRREALRRAAAALRDFESAALPARQPAALGRSLLASLGAKQGEAARWITVASLEEEVARLESELGFWTPELKALIDDCPVSAASRAAYRRRGESFQAALLKMKSNAEYSLRRLESDAWRAAVAQVEAALSENAVLRKDLSRHIKDFCAVPYRLRGLYPAQPAWRRWLENLVEGYLPSTAWGRRLARRGAQRALLVDAFGKIAAGDLEAAHSVLAAAAP